ncbi:hypothetical protein DFH27DRAFT_616169 [Peziza echinospora]|nr:hypothetical protein DFH27DRAFT_616169 [Peziza echinospora]
MSNTPPSTALVDYDNPTKTRGPLLFGITAGFFVLGTLSTFLRVFSRIKIVKALNIDDYLAIVAWTTFFFGIFYTASQALTKLSILSFYVRLSPYKSFHHKCFACIGVVVCSGFASLMVATFSCKPISVTWGVSHPNTKVVCVDLKKHAIAQGFINTITDGIILLLPIPMVSTLKISYAKKLAIYTLLGFGGFVLAISIVRLKMVIDAGKSSPEYAIYDGTISASWSVIELNIAIVCACFPAIRQLFSVTFSASKPGSESNELGDVSPHKTPPSPYNAITTPKSPSFAVQPTGTPERDLDHFDHNFHGASRTRRLDADIDVETMDSRLQTPDPSQPQSQENILR